MTSNTTYPLTLHLHVRLFSEVLKQIAALEVLVGVHNGLKLRLGHDALVLGLANLGLVKMFKDTVTG